MMKTPGKLTNQRGAVLIVSLVILVAMTLIAVTSMKATSTELSMAGNLRESSLTFQAAEAGLRSGEAAVEISTASINIVGGFIGESIADPDYVKAASWTTAQAAPIDLSSVGIKAASTPRYLVKFVGKNESNQLAKINTGGGYGGAPKGKIVSIFRITARASGQTGNTFRTVQSHYGIEY